MNFNFFKNRHFLISIAAVGLGLLITVGILFLREPKYSKELNFYNWPDYIAPETVQAFEKKYHIKVNLFFYDDEYKVLEEFRKNPNTDKYDLMVISDAILDEFIDSDYLSAINEKNVPNLKYIKKEFLNSKFNAKNLYIAPYSWGTTGLAFNTKYLPTDTNSWQVLWDQKYKDKISVLRNPTELLGMAAKYVGLPLIPQSVADMKKVENALLAQKKILKGYYSDMQIQADLVSENIWAAHLFNGATALAMNENKNIKFVIPKEGAVMWYDAMVIPKNAKSKRTAELFINFYNQPQMAANNTKNYYYASCNEKSRDYLDKKIRENNIIFPSRSANTNVEFLSDFILDKNIIKMREEIFAELISP